MYWLQHWFPSLNLTGVKLFAGVIARIWMFAVTVGRDSNSSLFGSMAYGREEYQESFMWTLRAAARFNSVGDAETVESLLERATAKLSHLNSRNMAIRGERLSELWTVLSSIQEHRYYRHVRAIGRLARNGVAGKHLTEVENQRHLHSMI